MINFDNCLPTAEMKADFVRFKNLKTDEERNAFKQEIQERYRRMTDEEKARYKETSEAGFKATIEECIRFMDRTDEAILRDKLGELPDAVSFSYIARKYFGKSRSWLYQRINGHMVNGKKARFTENELRTFRHALDDIGAMLNRTSLKLG